MLISTVAGTIHRFGMVRPGDRVLVALSGGPDSVALTHALIELGGRPASDNHPFSGTADELGRPVVAAAKAEPFEIILAHLNHQLRRDSSEDEAFCSSMAVRLDIPFVSEGVDVAELARTTRRSVEDAGRLARYRFFKETARRLGCTRIALGHTRDDQAETFLLRLLRGAGTTGLAAIRPVVEGKLIRPLLESSRREILEYLAVRGLPYRVDPTNADPSIPRNRVRNEALPYLESQFNPSLVDTLARNAELLREEDTWMEAEARRALRQVQTKEDPSRARSLSLSIAKLAALHPALQRRVIRKAIDAVKGDLRGITVGHVRAVLALMAPGRSGRRLALPGVEAGRSFDILWLGPARRLGAKDEGRRVDCGYNGYEYPLPVPGQMEIPEAGGIIRALVCCPESLPKATGTSVVVGLPEKGAGGLHVRSIRVGDRFRLLGAPGAKSVSQYLMERRVDRERRRRIPLVVQGERDILWVAGHGISETSRLRPGTRSIQLTWVEK